MRKEKKTRAAYEDIFIAAAVVLMILMLVLGVIHFNMRLGNGISVAVECEVVDKYYQTLSRGNHRYFMILRFVEGQVALEGTVEVSKESFYEDVQIGDRIPCEVIYDERGVIHIELTGSDVEQYSTADRRAGTFAFLGIAAGVFTVVAILLFVRDKKQRADKQGVKKGGGETVGERR